MDNKTQIDHLTRTVEYLEYLISDLSNTDGNCGAAYCFSLRLGYEERIVLLKIKIEELETELQQYKAYAADITAAVQNSICKECCPNIKPFAD